MTRDTNVIFKAYGIMAQINNYSDSAKESYWGYLTLTLSKKNRYRLEEKFDEYIIKTELIDNDFRYHFPDNPHSAIDAIVERLKPDNWKKRKPISLNRNGNSITNFPEDTSFYQAQQDHILHLRREIRIPSKIIEPTYVGAICNTICFNTGTRKPAHY